jgi:Raf kinase inhibitor-like YbhB/YbcL family protein
MKIESPAFETGDKIPVDYTADGKNVNPVLKISGISQNAKSLFLLVDDPDAKRVVGYTWIHWVVFNIPITGTEIEIIENSMPGTPGESSYKKPEYGGPNPPAGTGIHNYHFKVYALDKSLNVNAMAPLDLIQSEMKGHILDSTKLVGQYSRD